MSQLSKPEYQNLCKKANGGYLPVDYFRRNLFNSSFRSSKDLDRKKTVYDDEDFIIKVDRSLNQKHRDLLSLLIQEPNEKPQPDGSYMINTNIYQLAKKMGYPNPKNCTNLVYNLIIDMTKTIFYIKDKKNNRVLNHSLLGDGYYDIDTHRYKVQIPSNTAKYSIVTTGVQLPSDINNKIVALPNNKSRLKALISFLLSNKKLKNGIGFDSVCEKLDIAKVDVKSKFKKQVNENLELLKEFKISFLEDKFFLDEQIVEFERAITDEDIEKSKFKEWVKNIRKMYNGEKLCNYRFKGADTDVELYIYNYKIHVKDENGIKELSNNTKVENAIYNMLYRDNSKLTPLKFATKSFF